MKLHTLIKTLFIILLVISCDKHRTPKTNAELLCNQWELVKWEHYKGDILESEQSRNFTEYRYDFNPDGYVKISRSAGSVKEYTYTYDDVSKSILIPKIDKEYKIQSISESQLIFTWESHAIGSEFNEETGKHEIVPIYYTSYYYFKCI